MTDTIIKTNARIFLKTLDSQTLYELGLLNLDLSNCDFLVILKSIRSKLNYAIVLKDKIADKNAPHSLYSEYFDIKNAINTALANPNLYALFTDYISKARQEEKQNGIGQR